MSGGSFGHSPPSQSRCDVRWGTAPRLDSLFFWICPWHTADHVLIACQPETLVRLGPRWDFFAALFHSNWGKFCLFWPQKVTSQLHRGRPYLCKCFFWLNLVYLNWATWNLQFLTFYFTGDLRACKSCFQFDYPLKRRLFIIQEADTGHSL